MEILYQNQSSNYIFKYCWKIYIYTGVFLHLSVSYLMLGHRDIMTDGDSFGMGYTAVLPSPCSLSQGVDRCLPWAKNQPFHSQRPTGLPQLPVLMNSFTGIQLYPCVYILFCSCFGIRTGWEDSDRCHGTHTYGICHLSFFRENWLSVCLALWLSLSLSVDLCTTRLQHGHMGEALPIKNGKSDSLAVLWRHQ